MSYDLIENAIKDLTSAAFPPPYMVAQPATMSVAKRIFKELNTKGIYPDSDVIYNLLLDNNWEDKHAKYLVKRFKKSFQDNNSLQ